MMPDGTVKLNLKASIGHLSGSSAMLKHRLLHCYWKQ